MINAEKDQLDRNGMQPFDSRPGDEAMIEKSQDWQHIDQTKTQTSVIV